MRSLFFAVALVACSGTQPPPPTPDADAAAYPSCATVCNHLRALRCPAGNATQEGHSCEDVCQNIQVSGVIKWDLGCRSTVPTCEAIDDCP